MKKIYLFIPALFLSLGLLAQTPAPVVQPTDSLKTGTLEIGDRGTVTTVKKETIVANELDVLSVLDTTTERRSFSKEELEVLLDFMGNINLTKNVTYSSPGIFNWTVPTDADYLIVETYGGGGGGGRSTAYYTGTGGGGGGAYSRSVFLFSAGNVYPIKPGDPVRITVGSGGTGGSGTAIQKTGGVSSFSFWDTNTNQYIDLVRAVGGTGVSNGSATGGSGGSAIAGEGDIKNDGGDGADRVDTWIQFGPYSGGGGAGAGPSGDGGDAQDMQGGISAGNGNPNGNGGDGRGFLSFGSGRSGEGYGGGGSGGRRWWSNVNGGNGANGAVIIKFENIEPCNIEESSLFSQSSIIPEIINGIFYFNVCSGQNLNLYAKADCPLCQKTNYKWVFTDPNPFEQNGETVNLTVTDEAYEGILIIEGNDGQCYDNRRIRVRTSSGPKIEKGKEIALCAGVPAEISF